MGRDHTIFATVPGYVCYYRDPQRHKTRQYIGVTLQREYKLPLVKGAARKRRLGMFAQIIGTDPTVGETVEMVNEEVNDGLIVEAPQTGVEQLEQAVMKDDMKKNKKFPGYQNRITDYEIGKLLEKPEIQVKPYQRGARFLAWRKREMRKAESIAKKGLKNALKAQKGKKKKAAI